MRILFITLAILFAFTAQAQRKNKEDCLAGNCRNGFGLKKVESFYKSPIPGYLDGTYFIYYLQGEFKGGKLNGEGQRLAITSGVGKEAEVEFVANTKQHVLINPDSSKFYWFEKGMYADNELSGSGVRIMYDRSIYVNYIQYYKKQIFQGNFKNGKLFDEALEAEYTGKIIIKDSFTRNEINKPLYKIYQGKFDREAANYDRTVCTSCTMTNTLADGSILSMTGNGINDDFFSGWVIKNFTETKSYPQKIKLVPPYRALYIGGREIYSLPGTEVATDIKKVPLSNNRVFYGEMDDKGRPFGFGKIVKVSYEEVSGKAPLEVASDYLYEGEVNGDQPNGWGLYYHEGHYTFNSKGGFYQNGTLLYGSAYRRGMLYVEFGDKNNPDPEVEYFNEAYGDVINGPYKKWSYDFIKRGVISKIESGFKVNGKIISGEVSFGKTREDIRKYRVIKDGKLNFDDVLVGDIIVIDGWASPVKSIENQGALMLQDGRSITKSSSLIQLSKHEFYEFNGLCSYCRGEPVKMVKYTPPPTLVTGTTYRTEIYVGDYHVFTTQVPTTTTALKTYLPITRKDYCAFCNASGKRVIADRLKE